MNTLRRSRLVLGTTLLAFLGGVLYACKDFLATPPQGTLDEAVLTTKAGVEGSLIATYRVLDCTSTTSANWGCAASNWAFASITSDDAYKGSEDFDQPQATKLELYAWDSDQAQDYLNTKWSAVYEGVVRANATLRLLDKVSRLNPLEISRADSMAIAGEALFLRAHYHFEGWRMWGNIPYYFETDTTSVVLGGFRKANNTDPVAGAAAVANQILADLNEAIALLPASPRNGEAGRASAWTARAYKGRLQVYTGDYAGAKATLDSVVASTTYGLETSFDRVWTGFQQFANGKETILAYFASANDGDPDGRNANWGERLNFPHSESPFFCCGFHQPSQNLVNFYAVDAVTGLPKAFVDPAGWNARDAEWMASTADTLDPRVDWTVGRQDVPFKDWGLHDSLWIRAPGYGGRYSAKKNVHEQASGAQSKVGWNVEQTNSVHIHIFRYADLLLLLAEAEVELGNIPTAQTIVNQIRARAAVAAQGCGSTDSALVAKYPACDGDGRLAVPLTDPTIGWATYRVAQYTTPWPDQATARTAVRIERRLELAMEGQRLFDLRRYNIPTPGAAQQVINDYLTEEMTRRTYKTAQLPYASKHDRYPIPTAQRDLSKVAGEHRLTQNPNW